MKKKEKIVELLKKEYNDNSSMIQDYNDKIDLFSMCSKNHKNLLRVINTLGIALLSGIVISIMGSTSPIAASIISLASSVTLGEIITKVQMSLNKKEIYDFSLAKTTKQVDEEMIRYCIEKDKLVTHNMAIKPIYENLEKNKNSYSIIASDDFRNKDELLNMGEDYRTREDLNNSVKFQREKVSEVEEKLNIISSKQTIDKEFSYNKIQKYLKSTVLSLVGVFAICYLPNIGLNPSESLIDCIKITLLANIPLNALVIKGIIDDKKLYEKINAEIYKDSSKYLLKLDDLELQFKKMNTILNASKIQLLSDEIELSSKEDVVYYEENNTNTNIKEKEKVFVLNKK